MSHPETADERPARSIYPQVGEPGQRGWWIEEQLWAIDSEEGGQRE